MPRKPARSEIKTDLDTVSTRIAGVERNGHGETDELAREILEQRKFRLQKQNSKLDFELQKQALAYGDVEEMKRTVLRCNSVVKSSLFSMIRRISSQLVGMPEEEIHECLRVALISCFNDLAYEHRTAPPDG